MSIKNIKKGLLDSVSSEEWDNAWKESAKRSPEEKFENIKKIAKRLGCTSDDPETIKKFFDYYFSGITLPVNSQIH